MEDHFSESFSLYHLWPVNDFSVAQFEGCWVEKPETKALEDFGAHQSRCYGLHTFYLEKKMTFKNQALKTATGENQAIFFSVTIPIG